MNIEINDEKLNNEFHIDTFIIYKTLNELYKGELSGWVTSEDSNTGEPIEAYIQTRFSYDNGELDIFNNDIKEIPLEVTEESLNELIKAYLF